MLQKIRWLLVILGVVVLLTAMIQNSAPLTLKLFFFETTLATSILLLTTSSISFLVGGLFSYLMFRRREPNLPQPHHAPIDSSIPQDSTAP
jgi:H+/Cl- antiporter ClcA